MKKLIISLSLLLLFGCAAQLVDNTKETYISPDFTQQALVAGGVAILPVTAGSGLEGYRRPFGDALNKYAGMSKDEKLRLVKWRDTQNILNEANLIDEYQKVIRNYKETAMVDKSLLDQIGVATGCRYLLYVSLSDFQSAKELEYDYFAGGYYNSEKLGLIAFAQIWDAALGDVVWEGVADVSATSGKYSYIENKSAEVFSDLAAKSLIEFLVSKKNKKR